MKVAPCSNLPKGDVIPCRVVVIWIDWYAYHLARFQGLLENAELADSVAGIELVGGNGVHAGLTFREGISVSLPIKTLLPAANWLETKAFQLGILLWKQLTRLDPAVVLVPGYYTVAGITAALWSKVHGRRTVLMTESTGHDHKRVWWKEAFKGLLVRSLFDWAITGGSAHRRYLQVLGFRPARISRYYDVVDNEFFHSSSQTLRNSRTAADLGLPSRYFLYVGRLTEEKNVLGLINAYFEYREAGGDWSLVFVGDGPQRGDLRKLAVASGFGGQVFLEGLVSTPELPAYYAFAGCFVLPSLREPWGLVVNEAMASGLPLIVSDRCGCCEDLLRETINGYSFNPLHTSYLANRLTAMSNLPQQSRQAMAQASMEIIHSYSPSAWAGEIAAIARASN